MTAPLLKKPSQVSERDLAIALVLELAESHLDGFALLGAYDDDVEFLDALARRLGVAAGKPFLNKTTKVVRKLVNTGALCSSMWQTRSTVYGQPLRQMEYRLPPGKAALLTAGKTEHTMTPHGEAAFLVRAAYPRPDND